jgi:hypothetical protein
LNADYTEKLEKIRKQAQAHHEEAEKLKKEKEELEAASDKAHAKYQRDLENTKKDLQGEIDANEKTHTLWKNRYTQEQDLKYNALSDELDRSKRAAETIKQQKIELEEEGKRNQATFDNKIKELSRDHDAEITRMKKEGELTQETTNAMKKDLERRIEDQKHEYMTKAQQLDEEIARNKKLKEESDASLARLKSEHDLAAQEIKNAQQRELAELQATIDATKKLMEVQTSTHQSDLKQYQQEIERLRTKTAGENEQMSLNPAYQRLIMGNQMDVGMSDSEREKRVKEIENLKLVESKTHEYVGQQYKQAYELDEWKRKLGDVKDKLHARKEELSGVYTDVNNLRAENIRLAQENAHLQERAPVEVREVYVERPMPILSRHQYHIITDWDTSDEQGGQALISHQEAALPRLGQILYENIPPSERFPQGIRRSAFSGGGSIEWDMMIASRNEQARYDSFRQRERDLDRQLDED